MYIEITDKAFLPWQRLAQYEQQQVVTDQSGQNGATAVFVGTMRDFNQGDAVIRMEIEHYPGMTEKELTRVVSEAVAQWSLSDVLVVHRVGTLLPNDPIVLVAVWSAHRKAAFEACRAIMEMLKSTVPFWKKERLTGGERWVGKNTPGY